MSFNELFKYQEFVLLVGLLLNREGYHVLTTPSKYSDSGIDFEVVLPDSTPLYVQVKDYVAASVPTSFLRQFVGDIARLRSSIHPTGKGLFATSSTVHAGGQVFLEQFPYIQVWDGEHIQRLVAKHRDILPIVQSVKSQDEFLAQMQTLRSTSRSNPRSRGSELVDRLRSVTAGRGEWRNFENVGVEVLSYIFSPPLGAPAVQSRSEDGLDIMDAIFPIRSHTPPWSLIRSEYHTRFVVAEFKNYSDPIGQREVESIAQYLWQPAQRCFGLLISRNIPSESAIAARRRAWLEKQKMIVFLSDEDLIEMVQLREGGNDPFEVIDAQLEDFLRVLSP
jgi:hypothetical protein